MQDILGKMAGMNQTSATAFAGKIFGLGGAGDMVQASPLNGRVCRRGVKEDAGAGKGVRSDGSHVDEFDKAVGRVKEKLDPLFLVIAEEFAPAMKDLLDRINAFDTGPMLAQLRDFLKALKRSFGGTEFAELLTLSLQTGFEDRMYYGSKFIVTFGAGLAAAIPAAIAAGLQASAILLSSFGEKLYNIRDNNRIKRLKAELSDVEQGKGLNALVPEKNRKIRAEALKKEIAEIELEQGDLRAGSQNQRRELAISAAKNFTESMKAGMKAGGEAWSGFGPAPKEGSDALKKKINAVLNRTYLDSTSQGGADAPGTNIDFGNGSGKQAQKVQKGGKDKRIRLGKDGVCA